MPGFGLLPKEYNVRIHGAYFPGYFYGKPDTPIMDVKIGELPAWLSRRSRNPADWARAIARFGWRYTFKWIACKQLTFAPVFQFAVVLGAKSVEHNLLALQVGGWNMCSNVFRKGGNELVFPAQHHCLAVMLLSQSLWLGTLIVFSRCGRPGGIPALVQQLATLMQHRPSCRIALLACYGRAGKRKHATADASLLTLSRFPSSTLPHPNLNTFSECPTTRTDRFAHNCSTLGCTFLTTQNTSRSVSKPRKPVYLAASNVHPLEQSGQQVALACALHSLCIDICYLSETRTQDANPAALLCDAEVTAAGYAGVGIVLSDRAEASLLAFYELPEQRKSLDNVVPTNRPAPNPNKPHQSVIGDNHRLPLLLEHWRGRRPYTCTLLLLSLRKTSTHCIATDKPVDPKIKRSFQDRPDRHMSNFGNVLKYGSSGDCNTFSVPSCHATRRKHDGWDCPILDRGSREVVVGFEPRTLRAISPLVICLQANHQQPICIISMVSGYGYPQCYSEPELPFEVHPSNLTQTLNL
ncbi:hypothetical protein T265_06605 [Opisthorchis viverrini]|uniref:ATP synthase subunit f, mitochondrial n=1 Tax=Opisthorchis viverrini TaxID=6198 RepID=A0A075ADI1_OPIVI|nr:hypothetical protein T265_06605 [Opisthorchis viverrini]KER26074.1 hypothetical protein T265_06605 [Opisthorchis viverrini]